MRFIISAKHKLARRGIFCPTWLTAGMRSEVRTLRGRLIHRVHNGIVSLKEVVGLLNGLKTDLALKISREAMLEERPKTFS